MGAPSVTPARDAIETATSMLRQLSASGDLVPLNLFGAAGALTSDQPDFLATRAMLPYIFSMIGGRNWKSGPGMKASPLMTEVWTLLNREGALTAQEMQTALGRELTEGAVLRTVVDLWHGLRALPVYEGETTRWELTQVRFSDEMTASQKVAQTTALSFLVASYLDSAVAASAEEIETFLSPLTSRSRVREIVNGLSATRQLGIVSVGAQPLLHVMGSLPEFAEEPVAEPRAVLPPREYQQRDSVEAHGARSERGPRSTKERGARKPFERGGESPRPSYGRPATGRRFAARSEGQSGARSERPYQKREDHRGEGAAGRGKPFDRERKPFDKERKPFDKERKPFDRERKPFDKDRKPFGKKPFERAAKPFGSQPPSGSRPPFGSRPFDARRSGAAGERRPSGAGGKFPPKRFGAGARPWQDRGERATDREERRFERPAERAGEGERSYPRRDEGRAGGFGGARKFGGKRDFAGGKFGAGDKRSFAAGGRKFGGGDKRKFGEKPRDKSGDNSRDKPGEKRPFFRERPAKAAEGEPRPRDFRTGPRAGEGARPAKSGGGWKPNRSSGGFSKSGGRSFGKSGKLGFKSEGGAGFRKTGSGASGKPGFKGPGFKAKSRPGFTKSGPGASGKAKPAGFKPPYRKRKREGGENAE